MLEAYNAQKGAELTSKTPVMCCLTTHSAKEPFSSTEDMTLEQSYLNVDQ